MLIYDFVPFIFNTPYFLFYVLSGHYSATVQNRTHVYITLFNHRYLGNQLQ